MIKVHGSFTGIRIGLSTIKAFCDVTNKPCIGITSLEGFAYKLCNIPNLDFIDEQCSPLQATNEYYICSLLNANHGNAYCGTFKFDNEKLVQTHDYFFDSIDNIGNFVNNLQKNIFFVGNCGKLLLDMIESNKSEAWKICEANFTRNKLLDTVNSNKNEAWKICEANFTRNHLLDMIESNKIQIHPNEIISATDIGKCAFDKYCNGLYGDSNSLTPLYLKKSSAESTGTD